MQERGSWGNNGKNGGGVESQLCVEGMGYAKNVWPPGNAAQKATPHVETNKQVDI